MIFLFCNVPYITSENILSSCQCPLSNFRQQAKSSLQNPTNNEVLGYGILCYICHRGHLVHLINSVCLLPCDPCGLF